MNNWNRTLEELHPGDTIQVAVPDYTKSYDEVSDALFAKNVPIPTQMKIWRNAVILTIGELPPSIYRRHATFTVVMPTDIVVYFPQIPAKIRHSSGIKLKDMLYVIHTDDILGRTKSIINQYNGSQHPLPAPPNLQNVNLNTKANALVKLGLGLQYSEENLSDALNRTYRRGSRGSRGSLASVGTNASDPSNFIGLQNGGKRMFCRHTRRRKARSTRRRR